MKMLIARLASILLVLGCGTSRSSGGNGANELVEADAGNNCVKLAQEYTAAYTTALACDPSWTDACTAQRPIPVQHGDSLISVPALGFLSPENTAPLDEILRRYAAAGCVVDDGPGPQPRIFKCVRNPAGKFTCGGQ